MYRDISKMDKIEFKILDSGIPLSEGLGLSDIRANEIEKAILDFGHTRPGITLQESFKFICESFRGIDLIWAFYFVGALAGSTFEKKRGSRLSAISG